MCTPREVCGPSIFFDGKIEKKKKKRKSLRSCTVVPQPPGVSIRCYRPLSDVV
jgi:hypothetical protein